MKLIARTREHGDLILRWASGPEGIHYTLASEKRCLLDFIIYRNGQRFDIPVKKVAR